MIFFVLFAVCFVTDFICEQLNAQHERIQHLQEGACSKWTRASSFRRFTDTNICAEPIGSVKMRKTRRKLSAHIRILSLQCRTVTDGDGSGTRPRQRRASKKNPRRRRFDDKRRRACGRRAGRQAGRRRSIARRRVMTFEWSGAEGGGDDDVYITQHVPARLSVCAAAAADKASFASHLLNWTGLD